MWAGLKDFSTNKKQSRIKGIKVCPNDPNSCWWLKKLKKHVCLQNKTHSLFYSTNSAWKLERDPNSLAYNILNLFFYRSLFISIKNGKHTSTISTGNSIGWISIVVSTIVKIKRKCLSQFFFSFQYFHIGQLVIELSKKKKTRYRRMDGDSFEFSHGFERKLINFSRTEVDVCNSNTR